MNASATIQPDYPGTSVLVNDDDAGVYPERMTHGYRDRRGVLPTRASGWRPEPEIPCSARLGPPRVGKRRTWLTPARQPSNARRVLDTANVGMDGFHLRQQEPSASLNTSAAPRRPSTPKVSVQLLSRLRQPAAMVRPASLDRTTRAGGVRAVTTEATACDRRRAHSLLDGPWARDLVDEIWHHLPDRTRC